MADRNTVRAGGQHSVGLSDPRQDIGDNFARVLIHQPSLSGVIQGQFSDLEIQAAEIERMRTLMETTLARHTGKDASVIRKDTDRDKILTAEEAKDYGIIDTVLEYRKLSAQTA